MSNIGLEDVTGELRNCEVAVYNGFIIVWGNCYNDSHKRFDDGRWIHTSYIRSTGPGVVNTRNSVYKVDQSVVDEVNALIAELGKDHKKKDR
jgi:hypothetical protein